MGVSNLVNLTHRFGPENNRLKDDTKPTGYFTISLEIDDHLYIDNVVIGGQMSLDAVLIAQSSGLTYLLRCCTACTRRQIRVTHAW